MKKVVTSLVCTGFLLSGLGGYDSVNASEVAYETHNLTKTTTKYEKRGYLLDVINGTDDPVLDPIIDEFVNLYFKAYPKLTKKYALNPKEHLKNVTLEFDPSYTGVAYADNGKIVVSPNWILTHPDDVALFTHELTHIAQAYPRYDDETWWVTEGIADYTRYVYGPHNGSWRLPEEVKGTDNYNSGYRVTARFFLWLNQQKNHSTVDIINREMQHNTFDLDVFKKITGKTIDELWAEYRANPDVRTHY
ncbi:basic secretory protein-like protein [Neobacillus sp. NPDC097160]|uniref:basic secretory protein-like protein n=1 Tax=Neobacillus sp. NPDC097160 TaxID=3364298 RepID=UPI0038261D4B